MLFRSKVYMREEYERVRDSGSSVIKGRVENIIAISRTLGDFILKGKVSSEPVISEIDIDENDKWLMIGCDGVFDVITDDLITKISKMSSNVNEFALNIRNAAFSFNSLDNISVIGIDLKSSINVINMVQEPCSMVTMSNYSLSLLSSDKGIDMNEIRNAISSGTIVPPYPVERNIKKDVFDYKNDNHNNLKPTTIKDDEDRKSVV